MDSLSSVSPSIVLPPTSDLFRLRRRRRISVAFLSASHNRRLRRVSSSSSSSSSFFGFSYSPELHRRRILEVSCSLRSGAADEEDDDDDGREDVERALHLDGTIPGTSDEFVKRMSSRAYDMRRHLHQTFDSSSYDVLEANPWRETPKPVYVLAQRENQLCTMKTRRNRSEVERELGLLFSKGGKWTSGIGNQPKQSRTGTKFQMLVEDIREGVLITANIMLKSTITVRGTNYPLASPPGSKSLQSLYPPSLSSVNGSMQAKYILHGQKLHCCCRYLKMKMKRQNIVTYCKAEAKVVKVLRR